jgi:putative SOS response-associated peptidase YedK
MAKAVRPAIFGLVALYMGGDLLATPDAQAQEIDTKPAFREAFRQRRCLVPLDSFYEWQKTPAGKQP